MNTIRKYRSFGVVMLVLLLIIQINSLTAFVQAANEYDLNKDNYEFEIILEADLDKLLVEHWNGTPVNSDLHDAILQKLNIGDIDSVRDLIIQNELTITAMREIPSISREIPAEYHQFSVWRGHNLTSFCGNWRIEGTTTITGTIRFNGNGTITPIGQPRMTPQFPMGTNWTVSHSNISVFYTSLNNSRNLMVTSSHNISAVFYQGIFPIFFADFGRVTHQHSW